MSDKQQTQLHIKDTKNSELEESIRRLSLASEEQFDIIKHEKWYKRLLDIVTFSRKGEIRLAEKISTLAQTQQIVALYLLKESQQNKQISDLVSNNASYIEKLAGQSVRFKKELTSLSNLVLLINEINNGQYNGVKPVTAMCQILAQLDNEILHNRRALNNIIMSLENHKVLSGENIEIIDFLMDIADMHENEVPLVYTQLSTIRNNYYANLILTVIESYFFSEDDNISKDDVVLDIAINNNIEKKYDSTTLISVFVSFINSIIRLKVNEGSFSITNPAAKQEREEAEKLFYEGKLIAAYPKFIHAADTGDARACYFAADYYFNGYGTTRKSDELYKKYVELGIKRQDPFCYLEYSRYLFRHNKKEKAEFFRNIIVNQVGELAEKGDAVASHLVAQTVFISIMDLHATLEAKKDTGWSEDDKKKMNAFISVYMNYSLKAVEAGYWPAAFSKCFSLAIIFDGGNRQKNLEKYGWMFENVEWVDIQKILGSNYIALDRKDYKYYKKAAERFVKAYKLQKDDTLCGFISFFLCAGVITESKADGIEKKDIKILYYKGLDSKEPTSLQELGDLYYWGVGNEHLGMNRSSAFQHFEKAYERYEVEMDFRRKNSFDIGKAVTAFMLGHMLFNGIGTKQDTKKAVIFYQIAVEDGEKRAIEPLAYCYKNGIGVDKDMNRYNELMSMLESDQT